VQVALADFAHPRHACAVLPFARTRHVQFCAKARRFGRFRRAARRGAARTLRLRAVRN
jgi:hypothetical protein